MEILGQWYLWIKALHLISVIAWMAGMFYLPRLYVYHCGAEPGSVQSETFKIMERRLLRAIINPAMLAAWAFGLALLATPGAVSFDGGWVWIKLVLVAGLVGFHIALAVWRKAFAEDRNQHPEGFYRAINEVPTLLMIGIVIMAVVKPF